MTFNPLNVTYPRPALQHIFDRHKEDWGFADTDRWSIALSAVYCS